jgi:hypothetical protein
MDHRGPVLPAKTDNERSIRITRPLTEAAYSLLAFPPITRHVVREHARDVVPAALAAQPLQGARDPWVYVRRERPQTIWRARTDSEPLVQFWCVFPESLRGLFCMILPPPPRRRLPKHRSYNAFRGAAGKD